MSGTPPNDPVRSPPEQRPVEANDVTMRVVGSGFAEQVAEPWFARQLRYYGPLGPLVLTPIILIASVWYAVDMYRAQRDYLNSQLKKLEESITSNALTTLYSHGNELTKFLATNPDLLVYFDKHARAREKISEQGIEEKYKKEGPKEWAKIWATCVLHGDFMEETYARKDLHPADDWDQWWNFFCDVYDESFPLREYFKTRGSRWYSVHEKLTHVVNAKGETDWIKTKEKREAVYRGNKFKGKK